MNPSGARQERDGHRRRGEDLKPLPPPNRLARAGWKTVADGGERNDEEKRPKKMRERDVFSPPGACSQKLGQFRQK